MCSLGSYGHFDFVEVSNNQLHVIGWQATNLAAKYGNENRFLIVIGYNDRDEQAELGRTRLDNKTTVQRPDVKKVYNDVYNAENSGFNANVQLDVNKLNEYRNSIKIISRYSGSADGNSQFIDYISAPVVFDYQNYAWLDKMGMVNDLLHISGWNATNKAWGKTNHFIILYDQTLRREISRRKVGTVTRPDIAEAYPQVINADKSGFMTTFSLNNVNLTHKIQVISRFSDADNGEGNKVDYRFPPKVFLPQNQISEANQGQFEYVKFNGSIVEVQGWHASKLSYGKPYQYIIVLQNGKEIGRSIVMGAEGSLKRPDVNHVYPTIHNSGESGFQGSVVLGSELKNTKAQLIHRFTDDPAGNGNYVDIKSPIYAIANSYLIGDNLNSTSIWSKRDLTAQRIAQKLMQQRHVNVLYDWTNKSNDYQELYVYSVAQELAQGNIKNEHKVIREKLHDVLLDGNVVSTAIFELPKNIDYNQLADNFISNIPMNTTLEDSIVGVGATIEKIAIVLFEPGQKVAINQLQV